MNSDDDNDLDEFGLGYEARDHAPAPAPTGSFTSGHLGNGIVWDAVADAPKQTGRFLTLEQLEELAKMT